MVTIIFLVYVYGYLLREKNPKYTSPDEDEADVEEEPEESNPIEIPMETTKEENENEKVQNEQETDASLSQYNRSLSQYKRRTTEAKHSGSLYLRVGVIGRYNLKHILSVCRFCFGSF